MYPCGFRLVVFAGSYKSNSTSHIALDGTRFEYFLLLLGFVILACQHDGQFNIAVVTNIPPSISPAFTISFNLVALMWLKVT